METDSLSMCNEKQLKPHKNWIMVAKASFNNNNIQDITISFLIAIDWLSE